MRKNYYYLVLVFALFFLLQTSGCWEGREINERAFVLAVAFDLPETENETENEAENETENETEKGAKPEEFTLSVQIPDPSRLAGSAEQGGGADSGKPFIVLGTTTNTVLKGLLQLQREMDRRIFLGHTRLILISDEVARENSVDQILDYFKRNFQIQRIARVAVVEGKAREILEQMPPVGQEPTTFILNLLSGAGGSSLVYISDLGKYMVQQSTAGLDPVLPRIRKSEDSILTGGAAVIRRGLLAGWLTPLETRGFNILVNEFRGSNYQVECPFHPGDTITVEVVRTGAHHRLVKSGEDLSLEIFVRGVFETAEFTGDHGPEEKLSEKLTESVTAQILNETRSALAKAQQLETDILGIGKKISAEYNTVWREMDWEKEFPRFPVEIQVKMEWAQTIRRLAK